MTDEHDVRRIALALPEVREDEGGPRFRVRGKLIAWPFLERVEPKKPRVERRDVFAFRISGEGEKEMLLTTEPEKYFTTDHYDGYPAILVRLAAIDDKELTALLADAWRIQAPKRLVKEHGDTSDRFRISIQNGAQ